MTASDILTDLQAQVTKSTSVMDSATTLIRGIGDRITAAVNQAVANGATAEQLAPVQAEADALSTAADALSAAVVENTPAQA